MKRNVIISLTIDPTDYESAKDTPLGTIDLVVACLKSEADFATTAIISCQGETKKVSLE